MAGIMAGSTFIHHTTEMATDNNNNTSITICANCGKGEESSGDLKACTACKLVKYCNRECQIAHRPLPYTKRHARNVLLSYMMKLCSKSLRLVKNVQYALFPCHWIPVKAPFNHAVVNLSAMVVDMQWAIFTYRGA